MNFCYPLPIHWRSCWFFHVSGISGCYEGKKSNELFLLPPAQMHSGGIYCHFKVLFLEILGDLKNGPWILKGLLPFGWFPHTLVKYIMHKRSVLSPIISICIFQFQQKFNFLSHRRLCTCYFHTIISSFNSLCSCFIIPHVNLPCLVFRL